MSEVTRILDALAQGDPNAASQLLPLVYDELRRLAASRLAVPLMLPNRRGLIVHTTAWDRDKYLGNLFYDVAKAAVNRLAFGMSRELQQHQVAVGLLQFPEVGQE